MNDHDLCTTFSYAILGVLLKMCDSNCLIVFSVWQFLCDSSCLTVPMSHFLFYNWYKTVFVWQCLCDSSWVAVHCENSCKSLESNEFNILSFSELLRCIWNVRRSGWNTCLTTHFEVEQEDMESLIDIEDFPGRWGNKSLIWSISNKQTESFLVCFLLTICTEMWSCDTSASLNRSCES